MRKVFCAREGGGGEEIVSNAPRSWFDSGDKMIYMYMPKPPDDNAWLRQRFQWTATPMLCTSLAHVHTAHGAEGIYIYIHIHIYTYAGRRGGARASKQRVFPSATRIKTHPTTSNITLL
jgi:hypothetical protein